MGCEKRHGRASLSDLTVNKLRPFVVSVIIAPIATLAPGLTMGSADILVDTPGRADRATRALCATPRRDVPEQTHVLQRLAGVTLSRRPLFRLLARIHRARNAGWGESRVVTRRCGVQVLRPLLKGPDETGQHWLLRDIYAPLNLACSSWR